MPRAPKVSAPLGDTLRSRWFPSVDFDTAKWVRRDSWLWRAHLLLFIVGQIIGLIFLEFRNQGYKRREDTDGKDTSLHEIGVVLFYGWALPAAFVTSFFWILTGLHLIISTNYLVACKVLRAFEFRFFMGNVMFANAER